MTNPLTVDAAIGRGYSIVTENGQLPAIVANPFTFFPVTEVETVLGVSDSLRALDPGPNVLAAIVDGVATAGDGGGGTFYWDPTSALADNIGTVVKPTAHVGNGRWIRIFDGAIHAAWFDVGNGALSDDANFAIAIAAGIADGALYLGDSHRTIHLTAVATIANFTNLKVFGDGAIVHQAKNIHGFDVGPGTNYEQCGLHFVGTIQVDGGDPGGGNDGQSSVVLGSVVNSNIHDNTYQDVGGYGLFIGANNVRCNVHHNFFLDTMAGCQTGGEDVGNTQFSICDNYFKGFIPTGGAGTRGSDDLVAVLGGKKVIVSRNIIDKGGVDVTSRGFVQAQCIDITIVDGHVEDVICCDNFCVNSRSDTTLARAAILIGAVGTGSIKRAIVNRNIVDEASAGIQFQSAATATIERVKCCENIINHVILSLGGVAVPDGINVFHVGGGVYRQVDLHDNIIDDCDGFGIVLDGFLSFFCDGNEITDIRGQAGLQATTGTLLVAHRNFFKSMTQYGIITSGVTEMRATNNDVDTAGIHGISVASATRTTAIGNVIRDAAGHGLNLNAAGKSTVTANEATGCARGLVFDSTWDAVVTANHFSNNTSAGIVLVGANSKAVFIGNRLEGNAVAPLQDFSTTSNIRYLENPDLTSAFIANNRGTAAFVGIVVAVPVVFTTPEPDALYMLVLGATLGAGAAAGVPYVTAKTANGFTLNLTVPPGGVAQTDVDWLMTR